MNDQFPPPSWFLRPETWPYWMSNAMIDAPRPPSDPWGQSTPSAAEMPSGGLLGNLGQPVGGLLDNAWTATSGPVARNLPTFPQSSARPPALSSAFPPGGWNQSPSLWHPTSTANAEFPTPPARTFNQPSTDLLPDKGGVTAPFAPTLPPPPTPVPLYGSWRCLEAPSRAGTASTAEGLSDEVA